MNVDNDINNHVKFWADLMVGDVIIEEDGGRAVFVLAGKNELNREDARHRKGFFWHVYILVPARFEGRSWIPGRAPLGSEGFHSNWIWANEMDPEVSPIPSKHDVLRDGRFLRMD